MKANELMIGDWVQNPLGWKARVMSIKHTCVIKDEWEYLFKIGISKDTFQYNLSESDLSPIPLTPEILKKNGFEYYHKNFASLCYDHQFKLKMEKWPDENGLGGLWSITDLIKIRYVHELQQTMRMCSIEKEIIL